MPVKRRTAMKHSSTSISRARSSSSRSRNIRTNASVHPKPRRRIQKKLTATTTTSSTRTRSLDQESKESGRHHHLLAKAILEHNKGNCCDPPQLLSTNNNKTHETIHTITDFQRSVFEALCQVPAGKFTTYQALAQAVHCGSSQAVGQALKKNPYAPNVPCHRVVQSNFSLGGFGGQMSGAKIDRKRDTLQKEGVKFDKNGKVNPDCLFTSFTVPGDEEK